MLFINLKDLVGEMDENTGFTFTKGCITMRNGEVVLLVEHIQKVDKRVVMKSV